MIVAETGKYRLTKDFKTRGKWEIGAIPAGTVIEITNVDKKGHKVFSPIFFDWTYWEIPVEKI